MTVLNVTDATLKGSVQGPTFSGSVDGSKFSGSVTYTDTTTPPTEPPPVETTGPTGGRITAFNPASNGENVTIDNHKFVPWNANKPYSIKKLDDYTLRFEFRQGENCSYIGDSNLERSDIDGYPTMVGDNKVFKAAFRILIEPGPANTASWFVLAEQHNDDKQLQNTHTSPPFSIELTQEKFRVVVMHGEPSSGSPGHRVEVPWVQPSSLKRDQWYIFNVELRLHKTSGYARVWLDGEQIVNYTGPFGYGCQSYWMWGPYRGPSNASTFAAQYKNMTIVYP